MSESASVLLCGPSRAAVSGVSTHLNQLMQSSIADKYALYQFQVGSEGSGENRYQKVIRCFISPFALVVAIIRRKVKIVHLNTSMDAKAYWRDLIYLCISKLLGRRVVYQVHGGQLPSRFLGQNRAVQSFLRWSLAIPDVIVLLAQIERDAYKQLKVGRRILLIPNAIDVDEYRDMKVRDYRQPVIRLGYIGRLAEDKGVKETIEALGSLRRRGFDFLRLQIAGAGPYERALHELVETEALEGSVQFLGPVFGIEKLRFWRDTDLFVFPTYREGLPYTVLEALASGTPVIATRVGGIPDVVQDGLQGIFVNTHDSRAVAVAIETLVSDRERLRAMSRAAIHRSREHYDVERLAGQFDRLYQELLA